MADRPLRQFYDHGIEFRGPGVPQDLIEPWLRHRRRFVASLAGLTDEQWRSRTRCTDWDAIDVIWHLITADQFWAMSISSGTSGTPTAFLAGFDPTATPGAIAGASRKDSPRETLAAMVEMNESFEQVVTSVDHQSWQLPAESPIGHVPAHLALAHAFWDSWLHERDILLPLGIAPAVEPDELWNATWYSLFAAAVQGGLPFDSAPVAPGPVGEIEECLTFAEFPARTLEVSVGHGVSVHEVDTPGVSVGSALALVEEFTGRTEGADLSLPTAFGAHLERARQIL